MNVYVIILNGKVVMAFDIIISALAWAHKNYKWPKTAQIRRDDKGQWSVEWMTAIGYRRVEIMRLEVQS